MVSICFLLVMCMCISAVYVYTDYEEKEKVVLELFYETLCPFSKKFMTSETYLHTIHLLGSYIELQLIPHGQVKTHKKNGILKFSCQHGSLECYGNKLHACAIKLLNNATKSAIYNSCMMAVDNGPGSNDAAADECSACFDIDAAPIKQCAKGTMGSELLMYNGVKTKKSHIYYVPYISLNGVENDGMNLLTDVCQALSRLGNMNDTLTSRCRTLF